MFLQYNINRLQHFLLRQSEFFVAYSTRLVLVNRSHNLDDEHQTPTTSSWTAHHTHTTLLLTKPNLWTLWSPLRSPTKRGKYFWFMKYTEYMIRTYGLYSSFGEWKKLVFSRFALLSSALDSYFLITYGIVRTVYSISEYLVIKSRNNFFKLDRLYEEVMTRFLVQAYVWRCVCSTNSAMSSRTCLHI